MRNFSVILSYSMVTLFGLGIGIGAQAQTTGQFQQQGACIKLDQPIYLKTNKAYFDGGQILIGEYPTTVQKKPEDNDERRERLITRSVRRSLGDESETRYKQLKKKFQLSTERDASEVVRIYNSQAEIQNPIVQGPEAGFPIKSTPSAYNDVTYDLMYFPSEDGLSGSLQGSVKIRSEKLQSIYSSLGATTPQQIADLCVTGIAIDAVLIRVNPLINETPATSSYSFVFKENVSNELTPGTNVEGGKIYVIVKNAPNGHRGTILLTDEYSKRANQNYSKPAIIEEAGPKASSEKVNKVAARSIL